LGIAGGYGTPRRGSSQFALTPPLRLMAVAAPQARCSLLIDGAAAYGKTSPLENQNEIDQFSAMT